MEHRFLFFSSKENSGAGQQLTPVQQLKGINTEVSGASPPGPKMATAIVPLSCSNSKQEVGGG